MVFPILLNLVTSGLFKANGRQGFTLVRRVGKPDKKAGLADSIRIWRRRVAFLGKSYYAGVHNRPKTWNREIGLGVGGGRKGHWLTFEVCRVVFQIQNRETKNVPIPEFSLRIGFNHRIFYHPRLYRLLGFPSTIDGRISGPFCWNKRFRILRKGDRSPLGRFWEISGIWVPLFFLGGDNFLNLGARKKRVF